MVALASFASRTLGDSAIDNAMADLLLAVIVGWLNTIGKHEAEVVLGQVVLVKVFRIAITLVALSGAAPFCWLYVEKTPVSPLPQLMHIDKEKRKMAHRS